MRLCNVYLKQLSLQKDQYGSPVELSDLYACQWLLDQEARLRRGKGVDPLVAAQQRALAQIVLMLFQRLYQGYVQWSLREDPCGYDWLGYIDEQHWRDVLDQAYIISSPRLVDDQSGPLVKTETGLYLYRWWRLEQEVERRLVDLSRQSAYEWSTSLRDYYCALCDVSPESLSKSCSLNDQQRAIASALSQTVTLVSGGPGTGKTTTAARILQGLVFQYREQNAEWPRIRLLAPTGKAAARLESAILAQLSGEQGSALKAQLQGASMTIHRFLAAYNALDETRRAHGVALEDEVLRGHAACTAAVDIVIIDECSMIDLLLAKRLLNLLPSSCRVVMLGDPYQLPPVEPGPVFSRWVTQYKQVSFGQDPSAPMLSELRETFRFGGDLKTAADLIREGSFEALQAFFAERAEAGTNGAAANLERAVSFQQLYKPRTREVYDKLCASYCDYFALAAQGANARILSEAFAKFQVLSSTHEGPWGVSRFNEVIEAHFRQGMVWYHGKAILITENQHDQGIYNGDIGFVVHCANEQGGDWFEVHFPSGSGGTAEPLVVSPGRIRHWQPAYAMTVHKSQGSEYAKVFCVLAPYAEELLTRPLLYTALTRAREQCHVVAAESSLQSLMAKSYSHE